MAGPIGAPVNVTFGAAFTIPAGAKAFAAAGIYYDGASQAVTALGGSRISMLAGSLEAVASTDYMGVWSCVGVVNSVGSDTWSLTKAGFFSEGPTCQVQFFDLDDVSSLAAFLRQRHTVGNVGGSISRSVASTASDWVIAWIMSDGGGTVSGAISGFTAVGTEQVTNADKSRVFTANSPGASTTSIVGPANSYPGLVLMSIFNGTGPTPVTVNLSTTDAADTVAGTAGVRVGVSLSTTDASDTVSASAALPVSVSLSATDAGDTLSASAALPIVANLSVTDASDTLTGAAGVRVEVGLSATDESDTLSATAVIGDAPIEVNLAVTDADDALSATAALTVAVALSSTDAADALSASSTMPVTVNASATDAADSLASTAGVVVGVDLAATDSPDTLAATAIVQQEGVVSVTLDVVDEPDTLQAEAVLGPAPQPSGSGGRNWLIDIPVDRRDVVVNVTDDDDTLHATATVRWSAAKVRRLMAEQAKRSAPAAPQVRVSVVDEDDMLLSMAAVRWPDVGLVRSVALTRGAR